MVRPRTISLSSASLATVAPCPTTVCLIPTQGRAPVKITSGDFCQEVHAPETEQDRAHSTGGVQPISLARRPSQEAHDRQEPQVIGARLKTALDALNSSLASCQALMRQVCRSSVILSRCSTILSSRYDSAAASISDSRLILNPSASVTRANPGGSIVPLFFCRASIHCHRIPCLAELPTSGRSIDDIEWTALHPSRRNPSERPVKPTLPTLPRWHAMRRV